MPETITMQKDSKPTKPPLSKTNLLQSGATNALPNIRPKSAASIHSTTSVANENLAANAENLMKSTFQISKDIVGHFVPLEKEGFSHVLLERYWGSLDRIIRVRHSHLETIGLAAL
jgi:hypothetical protein